MPLQMAGPDAKLSLAAGMGVPMLSEPTGWALATWAASRILLILSSFVPTYDLRFTLRYRAPALPAE